MGEATALAIEAAAKLVRAEVAARPERVGDVLRGAIRRAADRSALVARVSPGDLATCRALAPVILEEMGGIGPLEIVDDPRIAAGLVRARDLGRRRGRHLPEPARPRDGRPLRPARPVAGGAGRAVSGADLSEGFRAPAGARPVPPQRARDPSSSGWSSRARAPRPSVGERCEILTPGHRTGRPRSRPRSSASARGAPCSCRSATLRGVGPGQTVVATGHAVQRGRGRRACSAASSTASAARSTGCRRRCCEGAPLDRRAAPRHPRAAHHPHAPSARRARHRRAAALRRAASAWASSPARAWARHRCWA